MVDLQPPRHISTLREAPAADNRLAARRADQIASLKPFATRNATFFDALLALIWISSPVAGLRPLRAGRASRIRTCRTPRLGMRICRVEVPVTRHLPHRSHRAAFPQWALVEGQTRSRVRSLVAHVPPTRRLAASVTRRPGSESGACVAARLSFDRPPSLHSLRRRFVVGFVRGFSGTTQPSDSSHLPQQLCLLDFLSGPGIAFDCGRCEVSQVPTRSVHP